MCPKSKKIVMNGAPVARHGLILGEDEATTSRKVFKHLPGLPGPVFGPKTDPKIPNPKNNKHKYFEGACFNSRHPGHCAREGRLRAAGSDTTSPGSAGVPGSPRESPGEFQMVQIHCVFTAKVTRMTLRCNVFFLTFHTPLI